jgi:hypothetical protein
MSPKRKYSKRDLYKLWFEYFTKSDTFKRYYSRFQGKTEEERMKLMVRAAIEERDPHFSSFLTFEDAIYNSFDYWWENYFLVEHKSIQDKTDKADEIFGFFIDIEKGIRPKVQIDNLWIFNELCGDLVIQIWGLLEWETEELLAEFRKIINERRKILTQRPKRIPHPTQPIRFDDIEHYLEIYNLRMNGKKWREIATIVHPKKEWNESIERALHIDFNNAKRIIKNVENNLFPGKY